MVVSPGPMGVGVGPEGVGVAAGGPVMLWDSEHATAIAKSTATTASGQEEKRLIR